jgi:vancomycin resistance protein YoaR
LTDGPDAPKKRAVTSWARLLSSAAVVAAVGAAGAWAFWPEPPPPPAAPPRLEVAGEPVSLEGDAVANALDLVRRYARGTLVLQLPDGSARELRPALLGAEIDRVRLAEFVRASLDPKSAVGRSLTERRVADPSATQTVPLPLRLDPARAVKVLVGVKDDVDKSAIDAVVDLDTRTVKPDHAGFRLDVYATLQRIEAALAVGATQVEAAGEVIAPRVVASQLADLRFDQVLGWFETRYANDAKHAARTYNLRLAASKLDGTVLLPGEELDFNGTVGPRDEAHGYRVAPVIAQGELVDGIGGGTCQISGTLHGAAFFAGLPIVERAPHTRPSSYIKLGLDAAVAYPAINFRLRNDFDFPIVLHQTVKGGVVRAEILGRERKRTVTFFRHVDEVIPFAEEVREVEGLAAGERVLQQRGIPGFKTTVFRVVREGAHALRTKAYNEYPPTTQIVLVGTGGAEAKKPRVDESLEYVADEYLVITQGPEIRTPGVEGREPGGGMVESRTPGKCGERGWQKKLGMPFFEDDDDEAEKEGEKT